LRGQKYGFALISGLNYLLTVDFRTAAVWLVSTTIEIADKPGRVASGPKRKTQVFESRIWADELRCYFVVRELHGFPSHLRNGNV
jgi:hypothetical protein